MRQLVLLSTLDFTLTMDISKIEERLRAKNKVLWVLITLVLGAIGSGLWEVAFKPSLSLAGDGILYLTTLGMKSLHDGIYVEVAKGQYERTALQILSAIVGVVIGVMLAVITIGGLKRKSTDSSIEAKKGFLRKLFLLFCCVLLLFSTYRTSYIVRAAAHFDQMMTICGPHLSESERLRLRSKFAQIRSKEQYVDLLSQLEQIAKTNQLVVPELSIF